MCTGILSRFEKGEGIWGKKDYNFSLWGGGVLSERRSAKNVLCSSSFFRYRGQHFLSKLFLFILGKSYFFWVLVFGTAISH